MLEKVTERDGPDDLGLKAVVYRMCGSLRRAAVLQVVPELTGCFGLVASRYLSLLSAFDCITADCRQTVTLCE